MSRFSTAVLTAIVFAGSSVSAQSDREGPAENPVIQAKVAELKRASRARKFARDAEAIAKIRELLEAHAAGLHKKDAKRLRDTLVSILTKGRLRKPPHLQIYYETCKALEPFGAAGAKSMQRAYERDRFPKRKDAWVATRSQLLRSIGKTLDTRSVEFLTKVAVRANEARESAAAGEALASFQDADQRVRKEIAKALINELAGLEAESQRFVQVGPDVPQDFGPANARARLDYVAYPWSNTLQKITGEKFDSGHEWQRWFNRARRVKWGKVKPSQGQAGAKKTRGGKH